MRRNQTLRLPIDLGETVYTVTMDDCGRYTVKDHIVGAYLVAAGVGYSKEIWLSAAGSIESDGFHEFDAFGAGSRLFGDWRGAFRDKEEAQNLANILNQAK